jgi:hypothetical protein
MCYIDGRKNKYFLACHHSINATGSAYFPYFKKEACEIALLSVYPSLYIQKSLNAWGLSSCCLRLPLLKIETFEITLLPLCLLI